MTKIVGNTVGVPNPISDWEQTDPTKADYIKNKRVKASQLDADVLGSLVYVGSGEMPEGYNIQIDTSGTETEVTISADTIYDLVINNQAEWDAAVTSSFGGAKNVLLNCDIEINEIICNHLPVINIWVKKFEYDTSIKETVMKNVKVDAYAFPNTLKSIAGNGHNINFNLSADASGDYTEDDYIKYFSFRNCSIKDVQFNVLSGVISLCNINGMFDCSCNVDYDDDNKYHMFTVESSTNIHRFNGGAQNNYSSCVIYNCSNIYNSSICGHEASWGTGFDLCNNLVSCEADSYDESGFYRCTNLIGCKTEVYDTYGSNPSGYRGCEQLVNCKASVYGGYGYKNCSCLSNCIAELDGGVSGFTGANTYCDSETCKEIEIVYE